VQPDTLNRDKQLNLVDELNRLLPEEAEACFRYLQLRYRLLEETAGSWNDWTISARDFRRPCAAAAAA